MQLTSEVPHGHWSIPLVLEDAAGDPLSRGFEWARSYVGPGRYYVRVRSDFGESWSYRLLSRLDPAPPGEQVTEQRPAFAEIDCSAVATPALVYASLDMRAVRAWENVLGSPEVWRSRDIYSVPRGLEVADYRLLPDSLYAAGVLWEGP